MSKQSPFFAVLLFALALIMALAASGSAQAQESQTFVVSIDNVGHYPFSSSGVFNTPAGASAAGPALPGDAYEFSFYAAPGENDIAVAIGVGATPLIREKRCE